MNMEDDFKSPRDFLKSSSSVMCLYRATASNFSAPKQFQQIVL